jgi:hypothetical protein
LVFNPDMIKVEKIIEANHNLIAKFLSNKNPDR